MLIRIVRLTLHPGTIQTFLDHFDAVSPHIRNFPGCMHLELWQDLEASHIITSCSHWSHVNALEHYRHSDLFKDTWTKVRPLFAARAEAFSALRARRVEV